KLQREANFTISDATSGRASLPVPWSKGAILLGYRLRAISALVIVPVVLTSGSTSTIVRSECRWISESLQALRQICTHPLHKFWRDMNFEVFGHYCVAF